jgi:hypothetical protein
MKVKRMQGKHVKRFLKIVTLILFAAACAEEPKEDGPQNNNVTDPASSSAIQALPPGFLDEPPPPPTSDSLVLSGGTLVTQMEIADAIVVVTKGKLIAWGQRGGVAVPNDSIGYDMRAKYIVPGTELDLQQNQLPALQHLQQGAAAKFLIIERFGSPDAKLLGYLSGRELVVETVTD